MKAIEASPKSISAIFREHEFVIPEYQRPYSWDKDQCIQLWEDLSDFLDRATGGDDKDQYFLGSVVVYPSADNSKVWEVIDGQQRLTTLLMFTKALLNKASTFTILERMIYNEDSEKGEIDKSRPRIESKVLLVGDDENRSPAISDKESLIQVLSGKLDNLDKNLFLSNYNLLDERLTKWWESKSVEKRKAVINAFQNQIVMLPIVCSSQDDALTLFQIVNDRGMRLGDADIFKAKIYRAAPKCERSRFINQWSALDSHENLFRIYMHISRAEKGIIVKEINLRKYIIEEHLGDSDELSTGWRKIMRSLKRCDYVERNPTSDNAEMNAEEFIYWGILGEYPNVYWRYPLFVFLHKHMMTRTDDGFVLPEAKHGEYAALLRDTVRYFFIKAVVHNSANTVKDTAFKVCADIAKGLSNYSEHYRTNSEKDISQFERKLKDSDFGRCRRGLVLLAASLNPKQCRDAFGKFLQGRVEIEHILPQKGLDHNKWDSESHKRDLHNFGNLMPLEKAINIKAGNDFFRHKQKEYAKSKVQDALDLAKKDPSVWYPEDVAKRHDESLNRLRNFFCKLRR